MLGAAIFVPAQESQAASINLDKTTCADLLKMPQEDLGLLLIWLHGGVAAALEIHDHDKAQVMKFAEETAKFCAANATTSLSDAAVAGAKAVGMVP